MSARKEPVEIPVYLFLGFLDSGKTKFITETLEDTRFNNGEKTLLLAFEDGEEEYEPGVGGPNVYFKMITEKSQMNERNLTDVFVKSGAERVVVEYNGMWNVNDFFEAMPEGWLIAQVMFLADAPTFGVYNQNMRQLVVDKLQMCDMVAFNRMNDSIEQMSLHKIVRGISRRCDILYDYDDGRTEYDEIEDPLPFDIEAPVIKIEDRDYAIWYRDLTEEMKKYDGKTVRFKGICATNPKFPDGCFVCGRHIMTCCVQDITYCGLVCKWADADKIFNTQWIILTARIDIRFSRLYGRKGPVLNVISVEQAQKLEDPVATFY